MNWNGLTIIWGEPNPSGRGQLNQLQLSGLSSQISGLEDLGWGTGKRIFRMTYSDSEVGDTLKQDVRKTVDSLLLTWMDDADRTPLTGCFLCDSHCSEPAASAPATSAENPHVTWPWIQDSSAAPHQAATKKTHWPTAILLLASTEICSKPLQMKPSCLSSRTDVFYNVWLW